MTAHKGPDGVLRSANDGFFVDIETGIYDEREARNLPVMEDGPVKGRSIFWIEELGSGSSIDVTNRRDPFQPFRTNVQSDGHVIERLTDQGVFENLVGVLPHDGWCEGHELRSV